MTAKQLTDSILQMAIQGKLLPQDPNDEPASVLLERIREEKRRLVAEGKLKKKDLEVTPISEDDIPFDIPEGWSWCTLGNIIQLISGRDLEPHQYNALGKGIPYMTGASNFIEGNLIVNRWTETPVTISHFGDLLITCKGTIGAMAENKVGDINIARQIMAIRPFLFNKRYFKIYLRTRISELDKIAKSIIPGISREDVLNSLIPIPPLEEQNRIAERYTDLYPVIKEYGEAYEEASKMDAELPDKLKQSILQEAIMGKLGTQDPNDEPANILLEKIRAEKQKLVEDSSLKKKDVDVVPIEKDPYEIPDSWKWVRLEDITIYISRGKSPTYSEIKKYPIVAQKCNQWSGFSLEKAKFADPKTVEKYADERLLQDGDLLWNSTGLGTLGRMAIYDSRLNEYGWAAADSHVTVIRTRPDFAYYKYLYYYFASPEVQNVIEDKSDGSTKQKELSQETVRKYEVPLPPLAEQHRIVQKIEELYAEIDNMTIENNINTNETEEIEKE